MENDEIQYIIKNSTFIKNNLLNKVDFPTLGNPTIPAVKLI